MAETIKGISARQAAAMLTETLGRKVTDKRVRSVARDTIERFGDDAYTAHAYSPDEYLTLESAMTGRGRGTPSLTADEARAAVAAARKATQAAPKGKGAS